MCLLTYLPFHTLSLAEMGTLKGCQVLDRGNGLEGEGVER